MPTTVRSLIERSLRLINVPGRGATLSAADTSDAFETLQELIDSEAVTRQFVPGIHRHFFALSGGQAAYTYGPGGELDTDAFDHPVPVRLEDAYIRVGTAITSNEQVADYDFVSAAGWTVAGAWAIGNGEATASGVGTLSQALALAGGQTYTIRAELTIEAGDVVLRVNQDGSPLLEVTLDSSGTYEYEIGFAGVTSDVELETDGAGDDLAVQELSILPLGVDRLELPDGQGSDYPVRIVDQATYNRRFAKGVAGRPSAALYSRRYPLAELRFDHAAATGEILVVDVLVNTVQVTSLDDTLRVTPETIRWLRYQLAQDLAPEYGKELTRRQLETLEAAYSRMASGNRRRNRLRVDRGLTAGRGGYNINRGDP